MRCEKEKGCLAGGLFLWGEGKTTVRQYDRRERPDEFRTVGHYEGERG